MANICVIAPAGKFNSEGLNLGIDLLNRWGHSIVKAPNLYAQAPLTAGTASQRAADLIWASESEDIDIIFYARGGYGTCEILELVDLKQLPAKPILVAGPRRSSQIGVHRRETGHSTICICL